MLGSFWLLSGIVTTFVALTARLAPRFSLLELVAATFPVAFIVPTLLQFSLASLTSALGTHTLFVYFVILAYVLLVHLPQFLKKFPLLLKDLLSSSDAKSSLSPFRVQDNICICTIIAISTLFLWPLYSTRMIPEINGEVYSGGSCWSDLSIHMQIVYSFISGRNKDISWDDMHSPVFAGERFAYPFLPDFHAAILVKFGYSMRDAFLWPGFLLAVSFCVLFYTLSYRITRSRIGSVIGLILTIFAGGVGAWAVFQEQGYSSIRHYDPIQDIGNENGVLVWFSFLPHVLLPQRGANFAYPMVLFVLSLIWVVTDMHDTTFFPTIASRRSILILAGFLSACLPLVQSHAFLGLAIIIGVYSVLDAHKWLRHRSLLVSWILAGVVAICVALPQMSVLMTHMSTKNTFMKRDWWYKNHGIGQPAGISGFFSFWWKSTGPLLPLFLAGGCYQIFVLFHAVAAKQTFAHHLSLPAWKTEESISVTSDITTESYIHASATPKEDIMSCGLSAEDAGNSSYTPGSIRHRKTLSDSSVSDERPLLQQKFVSESTLVGEIVTGIFDDLVDLSKVKELAPTVPLHVFDKLDNVIFHINTLSPTGRGFDAMKLYLASAAIFLFGNMYILQPWDRDNVKLFYLWVFLATMFIGQILAMSLDTLFSLLNPNKPCPGFAALISLLHPFSRFHYTVSLWLSRGEWSPPDESFPESTRVFPEPGKDMGSETSSLAKSYSVARSKIRHSRTGNLLSVVPLEPYKIGPLVASLPLSAASVALIVFGAFSGFMCLMREYNMHYVMGTRDMIEMGRYIRENVPPKSVMLHSDFHINPSSTFAGRPSLISFTGWMWSHGYHFHDRERDRDFIFDHLLDEDDKAYNRMRRWGVRYIVSEGLRLGPLQPSSNTQIGDPSDNTGKDSPDSKDGQGNETEGDTANLFANKHLKRLHSAGRYDLFEVLGYGFPPT